jgi:hypothetical protein
LWVLSTVDENTGVGVILGPTWSCAVPTRAAAYLSRQPAGKMIYPLVRELAADGTPEAADVTESWGSQGNRITGGSSAQSPTPNSTMHIGRTHCSTPAAGTEEFGYRFLPGCVTVSDLPYGLIIRQSRDGRP